MLMQPIYAWQRFWVPQDGSTDVVRDRNLLGPISLYTLVIAISGERKTSVDRVFTKPIQEWTLERREALQPDIAAASAAAAAWGAERDGLLQKIKAMSGNKAISDNVLRRSESTS